MYYFSDTSLDLQTPMKRKIPRNGDGSEPIIRRQQT